MTVVIDGVEYVPADPPAGHSPLPWLGASTHIVSNAPDYATVAYRPRKDGSPLGFNAWPANVALILRAVNHHHALVAFVKRCAEDDYDNTWDMRNAAHAILAAVNATPGTES